MGNKKAPSPSFKKCLIFSHLIDADGAHGRIGQSEKNKLGRVEHKNCNSKLEFMKQNKFGRQAGR